MIIVEVEPERKLSLEKGEKRPKNSFGVNGPPVSKQTPKPFATSQHRQK